MFTVADILALQQMTNFASNAIIQILFFRYSEKAGKFIWYQDLETKGAHLVSSFTINDYVYLIISSKLQEIKIFQVNIST